jgi:peptidoglycan lytic transglycosylase D
VPFNKLFVLIFCVAAMFAPTAMVHADDEVALNSPPAATPEDTPPPALPLTDAVGPSDASQAVIDDTNSAQGDLWQRIRDGFAMQELDSPLVARQEKWYANRPDYVARMTERAQRYLYYIVEEVERRGMPTEIALLPMIESAFNPGAYSTSRASGIWQFIPSTGKKYGMDQNWWYDDRRDIISATAGALDYLQKLHDQFGDWELALAAYNWGEGAVQRAQEHNRKRGLPTDYSSLKMPRETRNYVPKLLAVKNIISDPAKYGLALQPIPDRPYFAAISTDHHIDVKLAAELAEITPEEFSALNPEYNRPVILQDDTNILLLPVDKVETFRANLENYNDPLVTWQAYQSKKGERLAKLAPRFGLSVAKLKSVNGLSPRAKVSNGQTLLVPLNGEEADSEFEAFNTDLPPSFDYRHTTMHIVRKGETLGRIARHYHVSVASLKRRNGNSTLIRPGQRLIIAGGRPAASGNSGNSGKVHIVRKGETLSSIARRYHISIAILKRQNGNSTLIHPGQRLTIAGVDIAYNR